ncbi:MAG TPA: hypothetical protein VFV43_01950 [Limnobacter sp.]|nr:hypothetical protein [Limnobacter sp.]
MVKGYHTEAILAPKHMAEDALQRAHAMGAAFAAGLVQGYFDAAHA